MKRLLLSILLFLPFVPTMAHASNCSTTVGANPVAVPAPAGIFTEVGNVQRQYFEWMVPSGNVLLCAFVPSDFLPRVKNPASGMARYMLVETSRQLDTGNTAISSAYFDDIISSVKKQLGDTTALSQTAESSTEDASRKLKAIDASRDITLSKPTPLGTIFQQPNVYAFAMIVPVTSAGSTVRAINASVLLRVHDRLIFAYIYADGGDQTALQWTQQTAAAWAQQILAAN